jgi:hypothetical protein
MTVVGSAPVELVKNPARGAIDVTQMSGTELPQKKFLGDLDAARHTGLVTKRALSNCGPRQIRV